MPGGRAWGVRPAGPEDTAAVLELFEATFGRRRTEEVHRWKLLASPWPLDAPTAFVATSAGCVVGHLAGTPVRFRLGTREVAAVHIADVMVADGFRGQGVMTALGREANDAWAAAGATLAYAIPTRHLETLRDRLDYRPTLSLRRLWRPLRLPVGRRTPGLAVSAGDAPGADLDRLWDELRGCWEAVVVRDAAWLRYRYADAPAADYRILVARAHGSPRGYLVYREARPTAWIVDLFAAPDDEPARTALLHAAFGALRAAGITATATFAVPGTTLWRELVRRGFVPRRGGYGVRVIPLAGDLPWDALRDPARFLVAPGDFDVV